MSATILDRRHRLSPRWRWRSPWCCAACRHDPRAARAGPGARRSTRSTSTRMLLFLTLGIRTGTVFFFEAALVIAMLGFVATVALAKFLMRGEVIE